MFDQDDQPTGGAFVAQTKEQASNAWSSMRAIRPTRRTLPSDLIAGLTFAAVNIPQGLAYALMAGINPVTGLYTLMIATPIGALATGSVFMNVSSTSALAASLGDVMRLYPADSRITALITLVLLMGLFQVVLGLLKLGFVMQFVPNSVMVGFSQGVAVLIILGQLGDLTGYYSARQNRVLQLTDVLLNSHLVVLQSLVIGLITIGLIFLLERSRFSIVRSLALFLAMALTSVVPHLLGWDAVAIVRDVARIPQSLPKLAMPDLALVPDLLLPAAALGILAVVQGATVAQMYPNPNGKYSDVSRDFLGQGIANLATSIFQGIPAGGSISGTAVVVGAGAQTRWANIFGGLLVTLIVLLVGAQAEMLAMPALAGLLIVVGLRMLKPKEVATVWQTGMVPRASATITFGAALVVPLQIAILVGVVVAILLHVFHQAQKILLVELSWSDELFPEERPVPKELPSHAVTTLQVYGSVFFAAAGTFEKLLPAVGNSQRAMVILLLRGYSEVGSTFINALTRYARQLEAHEGRLILAGVSEVIYHQLEKTGAINLLGRDNIFPAEPQWGLSAQKAYGAALGRLGHAPHTYPAWIGTYEASLTASPTAAEAQTERGFYLEELERLSELHKKGILTDEEFTYKKRLLLGMDAGQQET
ncbi:MAG: SulP family inorganic anion transporter [Caldilineaceae bacterium]|nr:SulP family inorganic anion transporter [Caldilineaceae bacterium]